VYRLGARESKPTHQACAPSPRTSPAHYSAGSTTAPDGRRMSINVEVLGGSMIVQHYVEEIGQPDHLRMVSTSDVPPPFENRFEGLSACSRAFSSSPRRGGNPGDGDGELTGTSGRRDRRGTKNSPRCCVPTRSVYPPCTSVWRMYRFWRFCLFVESITCDGLERWDSSNLTLTAIQLLFGKFLFHSL
jgi:hypothetical protein